MRYFIVKDLNEERHLIAAKDDHELNNLLIDSEVISTDHFELKEDTFNQSGFVMSEGAEAPS